MRKLKCVCTLKIVFLRHDFMNYPVFFLQSLQSQLSQAQRLADMYRDQVLQLEDALARVREEGDVGKELFKVGDKE